MRFAQLLADEDAYHRELDRIAARVASRRSRRIELLEHDGVRLAQMLDDADRLVPLVARAVVDGSYRPGVATLGRARIGTKERTMGRVSALDFVVHGVVARAIARCIEPRLSDRLYSYRSGRSPWQALRWLASVARMHRRDVTDPRQRGLYVLRADVVSYTDSITMADDGVFFRELFDVLALDAADPHRAFLLRLLRPRVVDANPSGLLFGLPTTNVLGNLHLSPLDRRLETLGDYARFGDDMLFVHPDPSRVREAKTTLEDFVASRGLSLNAKKLRVLFWNGAPRASDAWPEATASREVLFLGASVHFDGTIGLPPEKWRALLRDVRRRIGRAVRLASEGGGESATWPKRRARAAIAVAEEAFEPTSPLSLAHAPLLVDLVDDRVQLAALDHLVAKWIAEAASGRSGPRAFRDVPWRWMREAGLGSRVARRNRA